MAEKLTPEMNAIRVWMRETMDRTGWNAQQWAHLAGMSPTNITRFLKDGSHMPTTRTIARLAKVAGTTPQLSRGSATPANVSVPVVPTLLHLRRTGAELVRIGSMSTISPVSPEAVSFQVQPQSRLAGAIVPGDHLLVEPATVITPKDGDVVVYGLDDGDWHVGQVVRGGIWSLHGGQLKPVDEAVLLGTAIELTRSLR